MDFEQNIKFVELYKDQTNLWNYLDLIYKNRDLRKVLLEHICMELGLIYTNEVPKKKSKIYVHRITRKYWKLKRAKKSGSDEVYKPSIK